MPYASVTRATLRARLTERVGNNSVFWTDTEKNDAINEAISVWQALTGYWVGSATLPSVVGQIYYTIPDPIVSAQRITYNGTPLTTTSLHELDQGFPGWENDANGTPLFWAPLGFNRFALSPPPSGIQTIAVSGIEEAPWLSADGSFIDIGDEELQHILEYGQYFLSFKEGGAELQAALSGLQNFFAGAAKKNSKLQQLAFYRTFIGKDRESHQRPLGATPDYVGARG